MHSMDKFIVRYSYSMHMDSTSRTHKTQLLSKQVAVLPLGLTYNTERPPEEFYSAKGTLVPRPTSWGPEPEKQRNKMVIKNHALIALINLTVISSSMTTSVQCTDL
jgi:hypothetical protein